jgi:hypothetical protein
MRPGFVTNNPDTSSAVYVFRSTGDGGASWNFTGHPAVDSFARNQATGLPRNDKPYMTADNSASSPFRDRIYVTWTFFNTDGTGYIMEVHSNDYGQTFSSPVLVGSYYGLPDCFTYQGQDPVRACVPEKGPAQNSVFRHRTTPPAR